MRTLGVGIKENEFYAPYTDDCWVDLAKAIMRVYADKYSYQTPTTAYSQREYSDLDRHTYLPIRKSVLKSVMRGPLRNLTDLGSVYHGFEERRLAYKRSLGIRWNENEYEEFKCL